MKRSEIITRQSVLIGKMRENVIMLKNKVPFEDISTETALILGELFTIEDEWEYLERLLINTED